MQIYILEIMEHWFVIGNGKQQVQKRNILALSEKDDMFKELMKWIALKKANLDADLVFAAECIALSSEVSDCDKLVCIETLFNRFSKFAVDSSRDELKSRIMWAEINSFETKLRGSVFE